MFDAVIDVICAQNTAFRRLYTMRANLAAAFGEPLVTAERVYHASPTPAQLAVAPQEAIRACGVGYRDRYIKGIAQAVAGGLDLEPLLGMPRSEARAELMKLHRRRAVHRRPRLDHRCETPGGDVHRRLPEGGASNPLLR
jgi:N-glycosylase/DNA lyase